VTLAIVIIALLVLLVIVDGSEASGSHHGAAQDASSIQSEDGDQRATGSPCILNVTSVERRDPPGQRRRSWKPARQGNAKSTQA
jgi:hypothetical protein